MKRKSANWLKQRLLSYWDLNSHNSIFFLKVGFSLHDVGVIQNIQIANFQKLNFEGILHDLEVSTEDIPEKYIDIINRVLKTKEKKE